MFILIIVLLLFKSRWTWQVFVPSTLVYFYPNLKGYVRRLAKDIEDKGKLDLLLTANSLSQHALFLKDRLVWLYSGEINFILEALKGDLSFQTRLTIISLITLLCGFFNLSSHLLQLGFLHLLLKHSQFGIFYRKRLRTSPGFTNIFTNTPSTCLRPSDWMKMICLQRSLKRSTRTPRYPLNHIIHS